jgi:hypothetical protein
LLNWRWQALTPVSHLPVHWTSNAFVKYRALYMWLAWLCATTALPCHAH